MSILDKVVSAVTPMESEKDRHEARARAQAAAEPGDWLDTILKHHGQVEAAFAAAFDAQDAASRTRTLKELASILTAHSIAEEAVIYPALVMADEKAHSTKAYTEQSAAKVQLAELETLDPMSREFMDKLRHVQGAVQHHVYEEESTWFRQLKDTYPDQARLTRRYLEEFQRYTQGSLKG